MGTTTYRRKVRGRQGAAALLVVSVLLLTGSQCSPPPTAFPPTAVLGGDVSPPPWQRTEIRSDCADYDGLRRPYFGEQHVHTAFSFDAYTRGTQLSGPREAYDYARGGTIPLPDASGGQTRMGTNDRTLDWTMVSDHGVFMGEARECITPGGGAFNDPVCFLHRDPFFNSQGLWTLQVGNFLTNPVTIMQPALCALPGVDCDGALDAVWQETQAAAEEAYDRTSACDFTSFVGYEHTSDLADPLISGMPYRSSMHRNLMFRNDVVPTRPETAVDMGIEVTNAPGYTGTALEAANGIHSLLWDFMDDCNDAGTGCEVLAIPHNTNLSSDLAWTDPVSAGEAERRRRHEPVVEVFQQKGGSECRFDRLAGIGVRTADEFCTFEQQTGRSTSLRGKEVPGDQYPFQRDYARNALKDGLVFEELLGVNPFEFGMVGSTDNHNATSGSTTEDEQWTGMRGTFDADPVSRISEGNVFERSPGGLAVAWAEENSRDAIFMAFRRREVYATSGHRPVVRFFGGDLETDLCQVPELVEEAYRQGVPMGGEVGAVRGVASPRFLVQALKDPGGGRLPGTDLQRVQIVKGWVDGAGQTQEQVFDVAGDPNNGASVDSQTCNPVGTGFAELCTVWEDPQFDPAQRAFYYARVLDNPTCRWSTLMCQSFGVNPLSPTCDAEAAAAGPDFANCCIQELEEPFYSPIIQERAWSSPIWYKPDAVSDLSAKLVRDVGAEQLILSIALRELPAVLDPGVADLTVRIVDDDEIYAVTLPAGTLVEIQPGVHRFVDPTGSQFGGLQLASLTIGVEETRLRLHGGGMDLSNADLTDHFVNVEVQLGDFVRSQGSLWSSDGTRILER
jgi:hypothetical protein